jgi:broad specificity phosphatase PhoE
MRISKGTRQVLTAAIAVATAAMLLLVGAIPAWAITVTFVRHGQSQANAAGFIDTSVPGPDITELGQQQSDAISEVLKGGGYDAIYASNMVRTQQTAAPLAADLNLPVTVLPGFREIDAGLLEGASENEGLGRIAYGLGPMLWVLGLRSLPIPGAADGNAFDARVDDALQSVIDSGADKPVVFAHGATIMFWVMMNVDNPDPLLIFNHPLGNTAVVVVNGGPEEGWTLENWDGIEVDADPTFGTKLFVNVRDLITTPQTSLYRVVQALETGDPTTIVNAIRDGVIDTVSAPVKFVGAVTRDVIDVLQPPSVPQTAVAPAEPGEAQAVATEESEATDKVAAKEVATTKVAAKKAAADRVAARGTAKAGDEDTVESGVEDSSDAEKTGPVKKQPRAGARTDRDDSPKSGADPADSSSDSSDTQSEKTAA